MCTIWVKIFLVLLYYGLSTGSGYGLLSDPNKPLPKPEMCSERDSPLEPFVLPAPGQPELARLTCGAHLGPPVLTRKQKRPRVNSLVCDRAAAFCAAGPPEVLSRMSRPVTQAVERERELARARNQRLKQAAPSLPGESVLRGFADRGALEGYPSHYTSLPKPMLTYHQHGTITFHWQ